MDSQTLTFQPLTLKNVLADPMVRLAMDADNVDPQKLAAMLACVARTLQQSPRSATCQQVC